MRRIDQPFIFPIFSILGLLFIAWLLMGCSTTSIYDYTRTDHPDGTVTHDLHIETAAEHPEGIAIVYDRDSGQLQISSNGIDRSANVRLTSEILQALSSALIPYIPED